jgi:PRTRC genetic system protein B
MKRPKPPARAFNGQENHRRLSSLDGQSSFAGGQQPVPPEALDCTPRATITLTDETVWLTRHDERGSPVATYPVAANDVAAAFNVFGADTGLLPEHTLFWQMRGGQMRVGVWLPPAKRTIQFAAGRRAVTLTIPLPGFVFVGQGTRYWIHAASKRPATARDWLYLAPLPNVHDDGSICAGTVKFPKKCTPGTISEAARLFFESEFNHDLGASKVQGWSGSLLGFLKSLNRQRQFPAERLAPSALTIGDVVGQREHERERGPRIENGVMHLDPNAPAPDVALWANMPFVVDGEDA